MAPRRYLRCLGQPALFAETGELVRFRTKKHLALLVFLAVEADQQHRRDRLAELLWPRVSLAEARHSLATALSVLRSRVGADGLRATRDQVMLAGGHLALDLERLAAGDHEGSETTDPLDVASFLEGFDIPESGEFGLWKDRQQARWLPMVMHAFGRGLERCRRVGDTRQIEQIADKMLAQDPACEDAVRAKMEVLAFAGDRLAALRLYEAWRRRIAEELDAVPSAPLERMAARLRQRGWERAALDHLPHAPPDQRRGRPFIGREVEYRTLYDAWQGLRQGTNTHILVTGESGVGKTRLVERLTTTAGLDGAAVSRVQSYELEQEIPYATVSGLILGLLAYPEVSGTPPEALAELSRTVPDVRRRFPAIPPARESQGDTARIELAEAFHQLLQAIAEERPIILVVDDVHLADDASLSVLHLVARRAKGERLMMIFIARLGGGAPPQAIERLMHGAGSVGILSLELRGLSREESTALLTCLADVDGVVLPAGVRSTLLRAARGAPMVLEFLLQDWLTNGDASLALAVSAMTSELAGDGKGSETYRHILTGLVRSLDPASRTVLDFAAILGPRLNDLGMYGLADLSLGQTLSGLVQLAYLRFLRETGKGFEFANELLRAEVYASVPSALRRTLHGSIADRLLTQEPTHDVSGLEIAWHCVRAGRQEEALPHLLSGARQAMRRGAAYLAERALETAIPGFGESESIEARLILAEALQEQGRWRDSLDVVRALPMLQGEDRMYAEALEASALRRLGTHFVAEVQRRIPRLLSLVQDSSSPRTRARAAQVLAYLAVEVRDQSLATTLLATLHGLEGHSHEELAGHWALTRAMLLKVVGETTVSEELIKNTIENLRRSGTGNLLTIQLTGILGTINTLDGKYSEAIHNYLHGHELACRAGVDTIVAEMAGNLSLSYGRLGDYARQLEWANRAPDPWGAEFGGLIDVQLAYNKGVAQAMTGRPDLVTEIVTKLEARMDCSLPEWIQQAWQLWKADLVLLGGRRSDALTVARTAVSRFGPRPLALSFVGAFDRWLAVCSANDTEVGAAKRLIQTHLSSLGDFDALDQIEILCGALHLATSGIERLETEGLLRERVGQAAPGVGALLRRLGFIPI